MTALFYAYGAETLALILAPHNWSEQLAVELALPTDINRTKASTVESRRAWAANARYSLGWNVTLLDANAPTELRIFLQRLKDEMVAAPMWADWIEITNPVSIGATAASKTNTMPVRYGTEWIVMNADASVFEIVKITGVSSTTITFQGPGFANAWPAGTLIYPLIFGRLTEFPQAESITDEMMSAPMKITENSAFARRLSTPTQTPRLVGFNISDFSGVSLFDIAPQWDQVADSTEGDTEWFEVGFQREQQVRKYPSPNARTNEFGFLQTGRDQILRIEWLWRDRRGPVRPFMYPTWRGDMRLAADANAGANHFTVEPTEFTDPARPAAPGDPYIAIIDRDNSVDPFKLGTVSGTTLNIAGGVTVTNTHLASQAILSHLLYGRFAEDKLTWAYTTDDVAETRIKFVELPNELNYYVAHGGLPANLAEPAYLYVFTEVLPTPIVQRFTSYENQIVIASGAYAGTYPPAPFSFGSIKSGLRLAQEKCEITSASFTGNPLNKFYPFAFDGVLEVEILEVDVNNLATAPKLRFYGEVWEMDPTTYKTTCLYLGRFFERKFPQFLLGKFDNGSPDVSSFSDAGTIAVLAGQQVDVTSTPAHGRATNWFAEGGYIDTGTGTNLERRSILYSIAITGGVRLILDRPLLKAIVGHAITLYPGYDGSIDQRESKFADRGGFLGHPYRPDTNPLVKAIKANAVEGGKK